KPFYIAIPRGQILVPYRPVNRKAVPPWSPEVNVAPPLRVSCPGQGLSSYLVSSYPVERLFLGIFMLPILHKKMHGVFLEGRTSASYRILVLYFQRKLVEVLQLPRLHMCRGIVCDMLHVPTPF